MKTPWDEIGRPSSPEQLMTRRADSSPNTDLFWFRTYHGRIGFLLRLPASTTFAVPLPTFREMKVERFSDDEQEQLRWTLLDKSFEGVFKGFAEFVMHETISASTQAQAQVAIGCTEQWKRLLKSSRSPLLSKPEQIGLIAELHTLSLLASSEISPVLIVEGWQGPMGQARDIILRDVAVEVKGRTATSRDSVQVSSEYQLQISPQKALFLVAVDMESDPGNQSLTLSDYVKGLLEGPLGRAGKTTLDQRLDEAGYHEEHDYSGQGWVILGETWWEVTAEFPKLSPDGFPSAISQVRYRLSTSGLDDYRRQFADVAATISKVE